MLSASCSCTTSPWMNTHVLWYSPAVSAALMPYSCIWLVCRGMSLILISVRLVNCSITGISLGLLKYLGNFCFPLLHFWSMDLWHEVSCRFTLLFLLEPAFLAYTIVTNSADIHTSLCNVNLFSHLTLQMRIETSVFWWRCTACGHAQQSLNIRVYSTWTGNVSLFHSKSKWCSYCKSHFPVVAQLVQKSQCCVVCCVAGIFGTFLTEKKNYMGKCMKKKSNELILTSNITVGSYQLSEVTVL